MSNNTPQVISNSQVFNKNDFYQKGFLAQSQISQTPHGIHQITTTEYPKDSTIVKLISSNAPGAITQVSPSYQVQSRVRTNYRHSTPPGVSSHSRTIIRQSESPIRYVTESISPGRTTAYGDRQIPVAAVVKEQIPLYIIEQQRQPVQIQERIVEIEKPIYVEKIVEVATDQTIFIDELTKQNALLEQQNRQLKQQLEEYRNLNIQPQYIEVQNNDRNPEQDRELEQLRDENEKLKRAGKTPQPAVTPKPSDDGQIKELLNQIEHLNALLNEKIQENNNLNVRITQIQQNELRSGDARTADYINKINLLTAEIDRLTKQMKLSREQYDEDLQKHIAQNQSLTLRLQDYETRYVFMCAELERLRTSHSDNTRLNQSESVRVNQLESRLREYEIIIQQKDAQLNEWKLKFVEMEKALAIYKQFETKLYECETVNVQLKKTIEEYLRDKQALQAENQKQQIQIRQLLEQVDALNALVQQKEAEIQRLKQEVNQLTINIRQSGYNQQDEVNRLNELVLQRNREIETLNKKSRAFEERIYEQEQLILQLQRRIEELKGELENNERVKRSGKNQTDQVQNENDRLKQENARLNEELNSLRLQISQLTININQLGGSRDELLRLQELLNRRNAEYEELARKYAQYSQYEIKLQECEMNNVQLRKKIEDLHQELLKKNQRISELEIQLREGGNLQEKLISATQTIEVLQRRVNALEQENNQYRIRIGELENANKTIQEYELRIRSLLEQNERLNQLVAQKEAELQKYRLEINQLTIRINQTGASSEELNLRIREIESLKIKIRELEQALINVRLLENRVAEQEQIIAQLRAQNENLQRALNDLQNQVSDERVKKSRQQVSLDDAVRDKSQLEEKLVHMTTQIEFMSNKIQSLEKELAALRQRNLQLESASITITNLESRVAQLTQTCERLNAIINEKDQEIQRLRQENGQLQINVRQSGVNQDEVNRLRREIEELRRAVQEKDNIIFQLRPFQDKLVECERNNADLRARLEQLLAQYNDDQVKKTRLNNSADQFAREKALLEQQIATLNMTIEDLNKRRILADQENQKLRLRISELENATRSSGTYEIKITTLTEEVSKLKALLAQKDNEINQLRLEIQQLSLSTRQSQVIQLEVNRLQEALSKANKQNEELKSRIREMELLIIQLQQRDQRAKELEYENAQLIRRIEELMGQMNDEKVKKSKKDSQFDQELYDLRAKLTEATNQIQKLGFENTRLKEQNQIVATENERLRQTIIQLEQNLSNYRQFELKAQEYERTIATLKAQIDQLIAQLTESNEDRVKKSRQLAEQDSKVRQADALQQRNQELLQQVEQLSIRIRQLESQLAQYSQFQNLAQQNEQLVTRVRILEQENTSYLLKIKQVNESLLEWSSTYSKIQGYNQLLEVLRQSLSQIQVVSTSSIRYSTQVVNK